MYDALVANVYMFYDTSMPLVRDRSNCVTRRVADREALFTYLSSFLYERLIRNSRKNLVLINIQRIFADVCS